MSVKRSVSLAGEQLARLFLLWFSSESRLLRTFVLLYLRALPTATAQSHPHMDGTDGNSFSWIAGQLVSKRWSIGREETDDSNEMAEVSQDGIVDIGLEKERVAQIARAAQEPQTNSPSGVQQGEEALAIGRAFLISGFVLNVINPQLSPHLNANLGL